MRRRQALGLHISSSSTSSFALPYDSLMLRLTRRSAFACRGVALTGAVGVPSRYAATTLASPLYSPLRSFRCTPMYREDPTKVKTLAEEMKSKGFTSSTPNFSGSLFGADPLPTVTSDVGGGEAALPAEFSSDLVTVNAENVDLVRDIHGPWLVMTEDLQGELFVDHDAFVFYRPANGLGYGVGKIEILDAKKAGTAFTLKLETYAYQPTTAFAPRAGVTLEVTGMVKKVSSESAHYQTFSLIGIFRKEDPNRGFKDGEPVPAGATESEAQEELLTGQFNAAKLSPWTPGDKDAPWQPNEELQRVFTEVFPKPLKLTSHLQRREERIQALQREQEREEESRRGQASRHAGPFHMDLEPYRVSSLPSMYYIPNYVSRDEEEQILKLVKETPVELKSKVTKRTVQEWGCTMCSECEKSFVSDANMPPWVQRCSDMLTYDGIFTPSTFPNSVRIHEYERGEGIGPHCDGPIYVPCVTVLSLASTSVMSFYPRRDPYLDQPMEHYNDTFKFSEGTIGAQVPVITAVLEPRSLLVFADTVYYYYPHGVSDKDVDDLSPEVAGEVINRHLLENKDIASVERKYRVSLTTRNLLTRCNHQPSRAEYNMKRAWYLYNQQEVPQPLFTQSPLVADKTSVSFAGVDGRRRGVSSTSSPTAATAPAAGLVSELTPTQLASWEAKMDRILAAQEENRRAMADLKELLTLSVSAEAQFRNDMSSLLNNITTTILDVDAKVEDLRDDVEDLSSKK